MECHEFLKDVSLFDGLNDLELEKVSLLCKLDHRNSGESIFLENDDANNLCILMEGQVDLRFELPGREASKEQTLTTLASGQVFGWSAMVPPHKMTLSSYAADQPCKYLLLSRDSLFNLFDDQPRIGYIVMKNLALVIANRFRKMEDEVARLEGLNIMHKW